MDSNDEYEKLLIRKKLLIFDFDGTLANTSKFHAKAFSQILNPLGLIVDYSSIAGMKTRDAICECLKNSNVKLSHKEIELFVLEKQKIARNMIGTMLEPIPGVDEFIHWAKDRFQLGIVTSGSNATVSIALGKLGYKDYFDPFICADNVDCSKPNPSGFLLAVKLSGYEKSDCLIFEDSDNGVEAAKRADISVIDVRKQSFSTLVELISQGKGCKKC
jgi:HAD superfamily hydrolase (TIGR01509 family)